MKSKTILGLVFLIVALSLFCSAQQSEYQAGKIVSIRLVQSDAQAARQPDPQSGQTDAPLKGDPVKKYEVVVDVGGASYVCRYLASSDMESVWTAGKEVQVLFNRKIVVERKLLRHITDAQADVRRPDTTGFSR